LSPPIREHFIMTETPDMKSVDLIREALGCADIKVTYDSVGRRYTHIANEEELAKAILSLLSSYRVMGDGGSSVAESAGAGPDGPGAGETQRKSEIVHSVYAVSGYPPHDADELQGMLASLSGRNGHDFADRRWNINTMRRLIGLAQCALPPPPTSEASLLVEGGSSGGNPDMTPSGASVSAEPSAAEFRVWWVPQIPMEAFYYPVPSYAAGKLLDRALGLYDLFQLKHNVKPDYSNMGGVEWRHPEHTGGDWESVEDEDAEVFGWPLDLADAEQREVTATGAEAVPGALPNDG
jgi:hypothetical protein